MWFRKLLAFLRQTFVTDCPVCHQHFYGFHPYGHQIKIKGQNYRIVCHNCIRQLEAK